MIGDHLDEIEAARAEFDHINRQLGEIIDAARQGNTRKAVAKIVACRHRCLRMSEPGPPFSKTRCQRDRQPLAPTFLPSRLACSGDI